MGSAGDELLSGTAIRKAVRKASFWHPMVIGPGLLAGGLAAGALVAGPAVLWLGASLVSASVGIGGFGLNYFFRPDHFATRYVKRMASARKADRGKKIKRLRRELAAIGASDGVREWDELGAAHDHFQMALKKREAAGVALDVSTLHALAARTLDEGLGHLRAYLATMRALRVIDCGKLKADARKVRKKLAKVGSRPRSKDRDRTQAALQDQMESIEHRLRKFDEGKVRLEEILAACERCEATLEAGALDIGTMREVTERFVEDAAKTLRSTVEAAREFNESFGREDDEADRIYDLAAGARTEPRTKERRRER